ncbi:AbrB/MazE/SpoVT family DNA-binding domain-containing protein [Ramlibacter sp. H39-3-26]|uniref:AbrB/MazE/SpoVT family DNA-binding domain-containing protein n=1 Tax=Curvibacter soli TaxID=3031331 RepID=UPI0023DC98A1|nr:AbrB/MazE/SpoVT family DNA-binding domain-containing protein [Ramlibacter sp. H39-3-26]MDF1486430.1 AbrB/MazE/SpoVT family DNA-binding domain-containing protein [Ramlibacter sp. H39-3-26]
MGARDPATAIDAIDLNVGRWGNSLAVRLPADLARELGIAEGSTLHVQRQKDNSLRLSAAPARKPLSQAEWLARAQKHLAAMPRTESVLRELRDGARY